MSLGGSLCIIAVAAILALVLLVADLNRRRCPHHWHAADAMIAWKCCLCGYERDGTPGPDGVKACNAKGDLADDRAEH